jgi:hypothetical protein
MKESDYQKKIIDKYRKMGWFVVNTIKTNIVGIPDLILLKDGEKPFFIECKSLTGKLSVIQEFRLKELKEKGFRVAVSIGHEIIER